MLRPYRPIAFLFAVSIPLTAAAGPRVGAAHRMQSSAGDDDQGLVFTENLSEAQVLFIDPVTRTRVVDFFAGEAVPEQCYDENGDPSCFFIGGSHTVIDDRDWVENSIIRVPDNYGIVARYAVAEPHEVMWKLNQLDFSGVPSDGSCTQTCGDPEPLSYECGLQFVHEFEIADENPDEQWVDLVMAEMFNTRVVRVHLDYSGGNTCGKVQWVLDEHNHDWPKAAMPNGVQLVNGPEGHFVITNLLSEYPVYQPGGARTQLWNVDSGEPTLVWEFPSATSRKPFTNATHNAQIQTDPITGQRYLLYGHSLGNSNAWNAGVGGSWGIAQIDNLWDAPRYMGDWILPSSFDQINFSRELEVLPDGTWMGVDSGCYWVESPETPCPAQIYWFDPSSLPSSSKSGAFSPTHKEQNMVTLTNASVTRELKCGLDLIFEADMVQGEQLGADLRAAWAAGGTACPDE